jgi:phosphoribosylaminoimidazole-succinocarboxamide synthase
VDTKYEFGTDERGDLVLIDEVHTPDSSRYWQLASYAERMKAEQEPEYFDKEFLRLWFKEHSDPYEDERLPEAPAAMIEEMSNRYIRMYEQITGTKFVKGAMPITQRLEKNLKKYVV